MTLTSRRTTYYALIKARRWLRAERARRGIRLSSSRAVMTLWLFAGLRVDEILRLSVGAIRWQTTPDTDDGGGRVCLLDVPTNKTTARSPSRSTGSPATRSARGRPPAAATQVR